MPEKFPGNNFFPRKFFRCKLEIFSREIRVLIPMHSTSSSIISRSHYGKKKSMGFSVRSCFLSLPNSFYPWGVVVGRGGGFWDRDYKTQREGEEGEGDNQCRRRGDHSFMCQSETKGEKREWPSSSPYSRHLPGMRDRRDRERERNRELGL